MQAVPRNMLGEGKREGGGGRGWIFSGITGSMDMGRANSWEIINEEGSAVHAGPQRSDMT